MRAVWSFWTKPFQTHRHTFWNSNKHHWFSWVVSVETARQHYPQTYLVTDDAGARLLVDQLKLPFVSVSTALNLLDRCDPEWWTLGKLLTYRQQTEPFIHIDNDVFLWKPLAQQVETAPVFTQNPEYLDQGQWCYQPEAFETAIKQVGNGWLPAELEWYKPGVANRRGDCCGLFGGSHIDFIRHYATSALKLVLHPANRLAWQHLQNKMGHMVLVEQYLLSACVDYHKAQPHSPFAGIDMQYVFRSAADAFNPDCATAAGYTHLMGAKRHRGILNRLELRVQRDYPEYYDRCLSTVLAYSSSQSSQPQSRQDGCGM
ncbi:hypothetical protein IQ268_15890 [Oculatella sp. LEGE 06141]|uniref:DUF6734 family protein n=1 Tax=Oculatella sp. LEGE 06141 TaxID=1828648 RepID=UPI0018801207|nr:DUF6734 family protein [Oculatella sp. LEGE 06141]MBE9180052.1 hypothetical protein [Oculatella sp. LEGE 06141]